MKDTNKPPHLLAESLGYQFSNDAYLVQALTHKSYQYEHPLDSNGDNEKLEFLGDAVIDLMISRWLLEKHPEEGEGTLSQKRAFLVKESELARLAREYGFGDYLLLSRGEKNAGGAQKPRLLASVVEAFFGAIFLDGGYEACERVGKLFFAQAIDAVDELDVIDFKTQLQKNVQERFQETPVYQLEEAKGPDHNKTFSVSVWVDGIRLAFGQGRTKKNAEQDSARNALKEWQ